MTKLKHSICCKTVRGDIINDAERAAYELKEISRTVMVGGLQNWDQTLEERAAAWQAAMDFMGLECKVVVVVVDGRKLSITAAGKDEELANAFIQEVRSRFPMGKYEREQQMIIGALVKYRQK